MSNFFKTKYKVIVPFIHFLLTFLFERVSLIFDLDKDIIATIAKSDIISDRFERVEGYIFAKLFAGIFIFFIWHLIFFVVENIKETYVKVFAALAVIGSICFAIMWPLPFMGSEDNLITYAYALRLWPEYWHSAYTSFMYTACLMVVPFAWFIGVFQWLFFTFVLGYIFKRIKECTKLPSKGRFFAFLIFALPGIFILVGNAYRTEIYTLLCIYFVSRILFDILDAKKASVFELIKFMFLCGLVSVWRTEGMILGLLGFGIYAIFVQKYKFIKVVLMSVLMVAVFVITLLPQKLGDIKYYGKDYSFINSFVNLQNILNTPWADLTYEGVESDLEAFEAVTPVELLKKYGMEGYRRYNYASGRGDINQSLASDEVASAYMSAYYNLLLHNPGIYARTQITMLANVLMIKPGYYMAGYDEPIEGDLEPWHLEIWDTGREDIATRSKSAGAVGTSLYSGILKFFNSVEGVLSKTYVYTLILLFITFSEVFIFFREIIRALKKKDNLLGFAGVSFVLLLQALAIIMVLPYASLVYLHTYYYSSFVVVLLYFLNLFGCKKAGKTHEII